MSKLNEMIHKLCPDGVEYKTLNEVATISRGGNFQKKDFVESGVPCIHYGQIYTRYGLFADQTLTFISEDTAKKQKFAAKNDIVMAVTSENVDDVCKCVAWLGDGEVAVSGHAAIIHHTLDAKYLTYYFHTEMFAAQKRKLAHGIKVIEVTPDKLNSIKIPVPPLEVQREIVRILDSFTEQTNALEKELLAELAARKKQYEYYRDLLLTFGNVNDCSQNVKVERERESRAQAVRWLTLSEIADVFRGEYITQRGTTPGQIPVILGGQEPAYYIDKSNHEGEIVVIARSGVSAGFVSYWNEPIFVTDGFGYEAKSGIATPKFLYYVLKSIEPKLNAMKRGAGVPHVSGEALSKVELPVPSLDEQAHIVDILDRFDVLCNDISSGLSAEIEARRKQYEYYRDALLTFKEKSA